MNYIKEQYLQLKQEIDTAIQTVFDSNNFILGKEVALFEKEFAKYCKVKYAVAVGSGTEALHLSLVALGIKEGDEVITVANTSLFTITAILQARARPVFVDINDYYLIDTSKIVKAITPKTKAILPVHLYGQCCDMDTINLIAKEYNLKVIEDACQAHGSTYKGSMAGSLGDCGCFSFYPTKNLGCYGDAGIVTTNDVGVSAYLKLLRNGGQSYKNSAFLIGFNSRMDEIQAAILRVKLQYLDEWNFQRKSWVEIYKYIFKDIIHPKIYDYGTSNYHLYVIRTDNREKFMKIYQNTSIHYPIPIHLQPAFEYFREYSLPVTEQFAKEIVTINYESTDNWKENSR